MKLIFCLAKDKSMMFFGKRQTKDEALREWILKHTENSTLWMSEYSAKQFENNERIKIDNDYITKAQPGDYCFIEDKDYSTEGVNEIIICKWNRAYPGDKFLNIDLKEAGFKKQDEIEIKGKSHEKITIETYIRKV